MRPVPFILGIALLASCTPPPKPQNSEPVSNTQTTATASRAASPTPSQSPKAAVAAAAQRKPTATIAINVTPAPALTAPVAASTVAPAAVPSIAPVETSAHAANVAPSAAAPSPSPTPGVLMLAPDAPPRIITLSVSKTTVHPGDTVLSSVETSSNVASVEVRVAGYSMNMSKVGVGHFALTYTVPSVPFFLSGTYALQVIARNTRGDQAQRSVPIKVH